jgi:vacuolar-type H+-ATPase catalytic subunit A/Vma1
MFGIKAKGTAKRERDARRSRIQSAAARDIGAIPEPEDPGRRAAAEADLRTFAETYFPGVFFLPWSPDHLRVIDKIQRAVREGGTFAVAMPRGSGKTVCVLAAATWALLAGYHRYVCLLGATEKAAKGMLAAIKAQLSRNDALAADFPEVCYPIRALENDARRCAGQLCQGKKTAIVWKDDKLVLPTIDGSKASGAVASVAGLTGAIRGQNHTTPDGRIVRPSLVIPDDPQTAESARSDSQVESREALLAGDVLGLAGPGEKISALMPLTVIRRGDLADRMLDRRLHPEWQGERTKLIYSFPTATKLWDTYAAMRADSLRADGDAREATDFYREHREEMDAGAAPAWPQRFNIDEISAVQNAMNLKLRDEESFLAEYQNEPRQEKAAAAALRPEQILAKLNGLPRGVASTDTHKVTAFIDVGDHLLHYTVIGWGADTAGSPIDYGTFPDQQRAYFTSREVAEAGITLAKTFPGAGREGAVAAGLKSLLADLFARQYSREDGAVLPIDKLLIDTGHLPDVVSQVIRGSGRAGQIMGSRGVGITAAQRPMSEYRQQPGELLGNNWIIPKPNGGELRVVRYDANHWKTWSADRLAAATGDKGSMMLYGDRPQTHRLFVDHLTAEFPTPTEGRGRRLNEWRERPGRDNHWWDCVVGAAVAGSLIGVGAPPRPAPPPRRPREYRVLT